MAKFDIVRDLKVTSTVDVVKKVGEKQAWSWLKMGYVQTQYRKMKNVRDAVILEAVRNDDRFKDLMETANKEAEKVS